MKDDAISPHIVLTPKTVRETSRQVFWLSLPCRPSQLIFNQWLTSAEALTPLARGRDHSGGSAPDLHGIPFALMCRFYSVVTWFIPRIPVKSQSDFPATILLIFHDGVV
jgi:hypothetical protein